MKTKTIAITTAGVAAAGIAAVSLLSTPCSDVVGNYAQLDKDGIVKTVIVADQCFIESGRVGDPSEWVPTDYTAPEKAAAVGGKYDATVDEFITKEDVQKFGKTVKTTDIVRVAPISETATNTKQK